MENFEKFFETREIKLINHKTKEVLFFESMQKASAFLGCNPSTLGGLARKKDPQTIKKDGGLKNVIKKRGTEDYFIPKFDESKVLNKNNLLIQKNS